MRHWFFVGVLISLAGCKSGFPNQHATREDRGPLPSPCAGGVCPENAGQQCPVPPQQQYVQVPPPQVEIRGPRETHVKVPPQQVFVNAPSPPQQSPPFQQPPAAPPMQSPMMGAPVVSQVSTFAVQSSASPRARPAVGLDWIRIPFPILRLFAVPAEEEVTVRIPPSYPVQQMVPMAAMHQAPMYAMPAAVPAPGYAPVPPQAPACQYPGQPCAAAPSQYGAQQNAAVLRQQVQELMQKLEGLEQRHGVPPNR